MTQQQTQPVVFARITKVDEDQRLVYGRAVQEVTDRSGEIFDYATSKPFFEQWSKSQHDASMGKSLGNIREMHGDVAAGVVKQLDFVDTENAIDIVTRCSDDAAWAKILDGVYTGYSIGGNYVNRWEDPKLKKMRYTANPVEISYVDRPAGPTCTFFEVTKRDGTVAKVDFKPRWKDREALVKYGMSKGLVGDDLAKLNDAELFAKVDELSQAKEPEYVLTGTQEQVDELTRLLALHKMDVNGVIKLVVKHVDPYAPTDAELRAELAVLASAEKVSFTKSDAGFIVFTNVADMERLTKLAGETLRKRAADAAKRALEPALPGLAKTFADEKGKKYPIDTAEQVRAAWDYVNRPPAAAKYAAEDLEVIKSRITEAWKEKVDEQGPPAPDEAATKAAEPAALRKSLYNCADFAYLLQSLCSLIERVEVEAVAENDESPLAARMMICFRELGTILSEMVTEEVNEVTAGTDVQVVSVYALKEPLGDLVKRLDAFTKADDSHQAVDKRHIQKMHDLACRMGAACGKALGADEDEAEKAVRDVLLKSFPAAAVDGIMAEVTKLRPPVAAPAEDFAKATAELGVVKTELRNALERVAALEAQPAPAKVSLRVVGKSDDTGTEDSKTEAFNAVVGPNGEVAEAASVIKAIHQRAGVPVVVHGMRPPAVK